MIEINLLKILLNILLENLLGHLFLEPSVHSHWGKELLLFSVQIEALHVFYRLSVSTTFHICEMDEIVFLLLVPKSFVHGFAVTTSLEAC